MKSHSNTILWAMVFSVLMMSPLRASAQVQWAIYLGGSGEEHGGAVALDDAGNLFISGSTDSSDFEGGSNTYHTGGDAFVAKISASGALLWVSYVGGSGQDQSSDIALDGEGNVFISGWTNSSDFEGANNVYHGGGDTFVAKLSESGTLQWATYLGGSAEDAPPPAISNEGSGIDLDAEGNAYVAGTTYSSDFEGRINDFTGERMPFLVKMHAASGSLEWMSYVGETYFLGSDGLGIAVDSAGDALVVGGYPGWDTYQGVVWKVDPSGAALWHSIFSSAWGAWPDSMSLDSEDNIFVTYSFVQSLFGPSFSILKKMNASGACQWSTVLGDGFVISANGVDIDEGGNAYVVGSTDSNPDGVFIMKVSTSGVLQSTAYFGGNGTDEGRSVVLDGAGNAFVTGTTSSTDFEGGTNMNHGGSDAFLVRLDVAALCPTDLDGDGNTGVTDLLVLLAAWGTDPGGPPDFDGDGNVGVVDLLELLGNWGRCL